MRNPTIAILFAFVFSLTVVSAQKVTQQCDEADGWSLSEANMSIGVADAIANSGFVEDCRGSLEDQKSCEDIMSLLITAEEHITYLLQIKEKNGCMTCFLNNALESAKSLDVVAEALYALGYPGVNRIQGRASFRVSDMMGKNCPDLDGRWYPNNDLNVSINMKYNPGYDMFEAEVSDGVTSEITYLQVTKYDMVKIFESNLFGRVYNNNNNINWGNHEWIRVNNTIGGRWTLEGNEFTIKEIAKGQYQMIVIRFSPSPSHGFKYKPGDVFSEFWTEDYIHFNGFVYTQDPTVPKYPLFLKFEDGVFYVDYTETVFQNKKGSAVMSKS